MERSISRLLAEFAVSLNYDIIPSDVINHVKKFLYDSIGCAFGALRTKDVSIMKKILCNMGGKPESTIIGTGEKLPAANAALLNSLLIRSLDFNDIYWREDPSHPSDLIPAALACGELMDCSMKEVLTAILLAYEFEQRLCEFASPGIRERKWHHATLTQFVSPIIAGKLLGLDEAQITNAIGISGCHNYTIGCPTAGKLSMMKNTVDPMAVHSGVFAALMAKEGYSGTEAVFEGKEGFMDCFFGWDTQTGKIDPAIMIGRQGQSAWSWNTDRLLSDLGKSFRIMDCSMKAFPTEALTHTHITCTLKAVKTNNIKYDEIESVTITTIAKACDILFDPHKYKPESRETADHSLPYCIAAAIVDREITVNSFTEEKINDPRIADVIQKIKGKASVEFENLFPQKQPSQVRIKTRDGRIFEEYSEYPKGDPREPMTMEDLTSKFSSLGSNEFSPSRLEEIKTVIFNCEKYRAKEFMNLLCK
jgi:2-methylcitrate dehydratase